MKWNNRRRKCSLFIFSCATPTGQTTYKVDSLTDTWPNSSWPTYIRHWKLATRRREDILRCCELDRYLRDCITSDHIEDSPKWWCIGLLAAYCSRDHMISHSWAPNWRSMQYMLWLDLFYCRLYNIANPVCLGLHCIDSETRQQSETCFISLAETRRKALQFFYSWLQRG